MENHKTFSYQEDALQIDVDDFVKILLGHLE